MSSSAAAIETWRRLLRKWRKAMDLVGPGPLAPHFVDAEAAVLELGCTGQWADLGSGAGFPGVALAAHHPQAQVSLVESRQKRAVFLRRVVREAGLANARVVHGRTEDLPDASLDGVISRAYKAPPAFLADAARLLRPGGRAVVMLGGQGQLDCPPGFRESERRRYDTGDGERVRVVLVYAGPTEPPGHG